MEMNELEQLRAQHRELQSWFDDILTTVVELSAENERLRDAFLKTKPLGYVPYGSYKGWHVDAICNRFELIDCDRDGEACNCGGETVHGILSQPTPTGIGAPALALARAGYILAAMEPKLSLGAFVNTPSGDLLQAAQPFIENPELRKLLGVE